MAKPLMRKQCVEYLDGIEFRKRRIAASITQKEISSRSGLSQTFVCLIESGKLRAKGRSAEALLRALAE